jgi:hypothetical protein
MRREMATSRDHLTAQSREDGKCSRRVRSCGWWGLRGNRGIGGTRSQFFSVSLSARFRELVQGANQRGRPGRRLRSGFTPVNMTWIMRPVSSDGEVCDARC